MADLKRRSLQTLVVVTVKEVQKSSENILLQPVRGIKDLIVLRLSCTKLVDVAREIKNRLACVASKLILQYG